MNDPYLDNSLCIERLYKEYKKHKKLVVAVDFDSTIFPWERKEDKFPKVIALLKKCQSLGFYICLFTASKPERFNFMREYLGFAGINVSSVNCNPFPLPYGNHGKMYYNILLCDRTGISAAYEILNTVVERIENEK